ncbi:MAG: efflux RND transporter periplasmic adaptor subunit [Rikenellaceae bacterium]
MKNIKYFMAMATAVALVGCAGSQTVATTEEEHAHTENLQLTAYSNDFEVYAEATPFVVGRSSDILAHFSHLADFKPLEQGSVTASLVIGTSGVRTSLDAPTRTGIYSFTLTPKMAGMGSVVFDITTENGKSQIVVPNIKVYTDAHDADHVAADLAVNSSNGAVFTKEQSWKLDFATEQVSTEPFGTIIKSAARVLPTSEGERVIVARSSGVVSLNRGTLVSGKAITASQQLFTIESSMMGNENLSVQYKQAVTAYNFAKSEYERKAELAKDKIVSDSELQSAKSLFEGAEIEYNNLRKNFSQGAERVNSPMSGFIKNISVSDGEYVEAGTPLATIVQSREVIIEALVEPRFYSQLGDISTTTIKDMSSGMSYTLEELNGELLSYGRATSLENPLIPVSFKVENSIDLYSGQTLQLYITLNNGNSALVASNEALIEEMGNYFVYRQLTPEFFEKSEVKIGKTNGVKTEIISGLKPDDRVVTTGAILVKLAQAAGAIDPHSGHVH